MTVPNNNIWKSYPHKVDEREKFTVVTVDGAVLEKDHVKLTRAGWTTHDKRTYTWINPKVVKKVEKEKTEGFVPKMPTVIPSIDKKNKK